jgi:hypothetical protein
MSAIPSQREDMEAVTKNGGLAIEAGWVVARDAEDTRNLFWREARCPGSEIPSQTPNIKSVIQYDYLGPAGSIECVAADERNIVHYFRTRTRHTYANGAVIKIAQCLSFRLWPNGARACTFDFLVAVQNINADFSACYNRPSALIVRNIPFRAHRIRAYKSPFFFACICGGAEQQKESGNSIF